MAENVNETVLSTIEGPGVLDENALKSQTISLEVRAEALVVSNDEQYRDAAEFLKVLKEQSSKVKDFFKPLKDAAHKAHKGVCDREKMMLDPLTKAEAVIKKAVSEYLAEQERKRKEAEERARRAAKAEADRRLAEAIALESQGRFDEAEAAAVEAEIIDSATVAVPMSPANKVKGVSSSKDWEIVSINDAKVPVDVSGVVIRPVDEKAIIRLIRASKGNIKIPGVTYREIVKMSVRRP